MNLTFFRSSKYKPMAITAYAISQKYFVAVHKDIISLNTIYNFQHIFYYKFQFEINIVKFLNENILVLICKNAIHFFDINSFENKKIEIDEEIEFFEIINDNLVLIDKENNFYKTILNEKNLYNIDIKKIHLKKFYKENTKVSAIFADQNILMISNTAGYIKIFTEFNYETECFVTTAEITKIAKFSEKIFVFITKNGNLILYDIEAGHLIAENNVRNTSIHALAIYDDKIFCSGEDNRLIYYSFFDNFLSKGNQTDTHCAAVFEIIINNGRIITFSNDFTIGIHFFKEKGFGFRRIVLNLDIMKNTEKYAIINNYSDLSIYKIEAKDQINLNKNFDYKNIHKLETKDFINCLDINDDYFTYSNSQKGFLYKYNDKTIEKIAEFDSFYRVKLTNKKLFFTSYKKNLNVYNLETKKVEKEILLDSFNDNFFVNDKFLILSDSNKIYDDNFIEKKIKIDFYIENVCFDNDKIFFLTRDNNYQTNTNYQIGQYNMINEKFVLLFSLVKTYRIDYFAFFNNKLVCSDFENFHIFDFENKSVVIKHVGGFILGFGLLKNSIFISQIVKEEFYENCEQNQRLKIKYKKKLVNK